MIERRNSTLDRQGIQSHVSAILFQRPRSQRGGRGEIQKEDQVIERKSEMERGRERKGKNMTKNKRD